MRPESSRKDRAGIRESFEQEFGALPDPRKLHKISHPLLTVVAIVTLGVMSGLEGWDEMAEWSELRREWLETFLDLAKDGSLPSADTLRRVFAALNPEPFRDAFLRWTKALQDAHRRAHPDPATGSIAIDGKALRKAFARAKTKSNLMLVSAFSTDNQLVLGQVRVEGKSNEIKAMSELLGLIDVRGSLVTIDAAGAQKKLIAQIVEAGGDYVVTLKGNQHNTHVQVGQFLLDSDSENFNCIDHAEHRSESDLHGRKETRRVVAVEVPDELEVDEWRELNSLVMVQRTRQVGAKSPTKSTTFYLSSLPYVQVERIANAIRAHWKIENNLHWCLDVQAGEDDCQIGEGHAPENLAMIRRFGLTCFKQRTDIKTSLKWKFKASLIKPDFLIQSILQAIQ